jgi:hypothetical protein
VKKKKILIGIMIAFLLTLTGCSLTEVTLNLKTNPSPLTFNNGDVKQDFEVVVETHGGVDKIKIDNILLEVKNEKEETIFRANPQLDDTETYAVGGVTLRVDETLNLKEVFEKHEMTNEEFEVFYAQNLEGKNYTMEITLTGTQNSTFKTQIVFN